MWDKVNDGGHKCSISVCKICSKKHYARGYCRKHYNNLLSGRQIQPKLCKVCNKKKVFVRIKENICCDCYAKSIIVKRVFTGGKWGYTKYNKIQQHKKDTCEICNSVGNLVIHHIDKNRGNPNIKNLITVCRKCHFRNFHPEVKRPLNKK